MTEPSTVPRPPESSASLEAAGPAEPAEAPAGARATGVVSVVVGLEVPETRDGGLNRVVAETARERHRRGLPGSVLAWGEGTDVAGLSPVRPARAALPRRLWALRRRVRREMRSAAVVQVHFALTALAVLGRRRPPMVMFWHGPWAGESSVLGQASLRVAAKKRVEGYVLRRCRSIMVASSAFAELLVAEYGVHPGRVQVCPLGVDLDRFTPADPGETAAAARQRARGALGLEDADLTVVCVRRLVRRMGHDVLLDAWASLADDDTLGRAQLLIVGTGPEEPALRAQVARLGLDKTVTFAGRLSDDDLVLAYRAADLSVVPTTALEGFGLISLESLATGTPVVASEQGGLVDALAGSGAHEFAAPGDADALAAALRRLQARLATEPSIGAAARAHAETFSWAAHVDGTEEQVAVAAGGRVTQVVVLNHSAKPSGAEIAMERVIAHAAGEVAVHLICGEDGPMVERWRAAGATVEIRPLSASTAGMTRAGGVRALRHVAVGMVIDIVRMRRRLRELAPDVVHVNTAKAWVYGGLAARAAGLPAIWHARDRIDEAYFSTLGARLLRLLAHAVPQGVVANSHSTLATVPGHRMTRTVSYSPIPAQPLAVAPGAPVIGMAGRIADWKGHAVLLRAVASLLADDAPALAGLRVRVAGAPLFNEQPVQDSLEALAADLGIADRIDWLGHCDDLGVERAGWGVAVHASTIAEPFGMVVVEAMAAGLPVIATGAGGPAEVITDDVDGLLVPPGDVDAMAAALRRVLGDPTLASRLGAQARERSVDFSPGRAVAALRSSWDSVGRLR